MKKYFKFKEWYLLIALRVINSGIFLAGQAIDLMIKLMKYRRRLKKNLKRLKRELKR